MGTSLEANANSKQAYWESHLQAWRGSGKTQQAYCRDAKLKPNTFWYWKRKLTAPEVSIVPVNEAAQQQSAFVAVDIHPPQQPTLGELAITLPNGIQMTGVNAQNLPLVKLLVEGLA